MSYSEFDPTPRDIAQARAQTVAIQANCYHCGHVMECCYCGELYPQRHKRQTDG